MEEGRGREGGGGVTPSYIYEPLEIKGHIQGPML